MNLTMVLAHSLNYDGLIAFGFAIFFFITCVAFAVIIGIVCLVRKKRHAVLRVPEALQFDIELKPVTTKDNVTILADALATVKITEPELFAHDCARNIAADTGQILEISLEAFLGACELESCLTNQDELSRRIKDNLSTIIDKPGITVTQVQLANIEQIQDNQEVPVRRGCIIKKLFIKGGKFSQRTGIPLGFFALFFVLTALLPAYYLQESPLIFIIALLFIPHGIALAVTYFTAKKRAIPSAELNDAAQKPKRSVSVWERFMKTWAKHFALWLISLFVIGVLIIILRYFNVLESSRVLHTADIIESVSVAGLVVFIPTVILTYLITFRK